MTYFDERASTWDQNPMRIERAAAVAGAIRARIALSADTRALEYGCGTGLLSFALQQGGPLGRISLADNSEGMLAVLAEKIQAAGLSAMQPLKLDLANDPLPAERFDLIYSLLTLHHIRETQPVLQAFYDLLAPGGWLALADLDAEDGSFHDEPFDGHFGFARDEMQAQLADLGFSRIRFETVYSMTKSRAGQERRYDVFLATACKACAV
jgi:ubiquinone/menaquinone biosynthesis C-methylase UbiE